MIRKLCINDKEQYLALLEQLTTVGNINDSNWFLLFQKMEKNPYIEIYVFVAMPDKQITTQEPQSQEILLAAGTLLLEQKFIHEGSVVGHIEDVVVAERARGLGLGKEIVNFLIRRAAECDAYKVILNTAEKTQGFYEKLGFYRHEVQMRLDLDKIKAKI